MISTRKLPMKGRSGRRESEDGEKSEERTELARLIIRPYRQSKQSDVEQYQRNERECQSPREKVGFSASTFSLFDTLGPQRDLQ